MEALNVSQGIGGLDFSFTPHNNEGFCLGNENFFFFRGSVGKSWQRLFCDCNRIFFRISYTEKAACYKETFKNFFFMKMIVSLKGIF